MVHLNKCCFWSCCHARWDDFICQQTKPVCSSLFEYVDVVFKYLFEQKPSEHEHTGHIDCHCGHKANETVEEARTGGRIHLNDACFWSCCHARWDDFNCKLQHEEATTPVCERDFFVVNCFQCFVFRHSNSRGQRLTNTEGTLNASAATISARHSKKRGTALSSIGTVPVPGHAATRIGVTLTARDPVLFVPFLYCH